MPERGNPAILIGLIALHILVYVLQLQNANATSLLAVVPADVWSGRAPQGVFTYMWAHDPHGLLHIAFNMLVLAMFGSSLVAEWEPWRFFVYYIGCGVGAGIIIAAWPALTWWNDIAPYRQTVGASGAVYGVLLAISVLWPDRPVRLLIGGEVRAAWMIPIFFLVAFVFGGPNISHIGHLGGVIAGWLILWAWGMTPPFDRRSIQRRIDRYKMRRRLKQAHRDLR